MPVRNPQPQSKYNNKKAVEKQKNLDNTCDYPVFLNIQNF